MGNYSTVTDCLLHQWEKHINFGDDYTKKGSDASMLCYNVCSDSMCQ